MAAGKTDATEKNLENVPTYKWLDRSQSVQIIPSHFLLHLPNILVHEQFSESDFYLWLEKLCFDLVL